MLLSARVSSEYEYCTAPGDAAVCQGFLRVRLLHRSWRCCCLPGFPQSTSAAPLLAMLLSARVSSEYEYCTAPGDAAVCQGFLRVRLLHRSWRCCCLPGFPQSTSAAPLLAMLLSARVSSEYECCTAPGDAAVCQGFLRVRVLHRSWRCCCLPGFPQSTSAAPLLAMLLSARVSSEYECCTAPGDAAVCQGFLRVRVLHRSWRCCCLPGFPQSTSAAPLLAMLLSARVSSEYECCTAPGDAAVCQGFLRVRVLHRSWRCCCLPGFPQGTSAAPLLAMLLSARVSSGYECCTAPGDAAVCQGFLRVRVLHRSWRCCWLRGCTSAAPLLAMLLSARVSSGYECCTAPGDAAVCQGFLRVRVLHRSWRCCCLPGFPQGTSAAPLLAMLLSARVSSGYEAGIIMVSESYFKSIVWGYTFVFGLKAEWRICQ
ncbi:hypothetical protein EOD39_17541 [Acipenser ruthenus]|uniref:Uncharacterized protein n=1 Tax=Acipenser ruthenus TaxID=7906 RepID=A0A444V366_ACIRT|nr:hypothetical protein EOD39_17541 [Acipenser ruthenus]